MEMVGVSEKDVHDIVHVARRRRLMMIIAGGVGTIAAMIAGYLTAIHFFNDSHMGVSDSYPFIPPMAAISAAGSRPKLGVVGIVAVVCAAFVMMFVLTAAAYTSTRTVTFYGVWHDGVGVRHHAQRI